MQNRFELFLSLVKRMTLKYPVSNVARLWFQQLSFEQKQVLAQTAEISYSYLCRIFAEKSDMTYSLAFTIVSLTHGTFQLKDICPELDGGMQIEARSFKDKKFSLDPLSIIPFPNICGKA